MGKPPPLLESNPKGGKDGMVHNDVQMRCLYISIIPPPKKGRILQGGCIMR